MHAKRACSLILTAFAALALPASAGTIPQYINYQGKLGDSSGNPLSGAYSFRFKLYNAETGGTQLFTEDVTGANAVSVVNGIYTVQIGSVTAGGISTAAFANAGVWLELDVNAGATLVGAETLTPRERFAATPFAFRAVAADFLGGGAVVSTFTSQGLMLFPFEVRAGSMSLTSGLTASSGTFTASGATQYSVQTTSGINVGGTGGVVASFFVGNGAALTGITATDSTRVSKAGDTMTGQLTMSGSTLTITGPESTSTEEFLRITKRTFGGSIFRQYYDASTAYGMQIMGTENRIPFVTDTSVNPPRVGIAGVMLPQTNLDVGGNAQFGSGTTKSTFTTTGALTLAANAGLTLSGATGNITSGSSITTTGGFFGSGAGLTSVTAASVNAGSIINGPVATGMLPSTIAYTGDANAFSGLNVFSNTTRVNANLQVDGALTSSNQTGLTISTPAYMNSGVSIGGAGGGEYGSVAYGVTYGPSTADYRYRFSDTANHLQFAGGQYVFSNAPAGTVGNPITFTERMRLTAQGALGVGTNAPTNRLDVNGGLTASSGTFNLIGAVSVQTSSGINVSAGGVTAPWFSGAYYGNGAGLTGVSDATKVSKAGDSMSGPLTIYSSHTVTGAVGIGAVDLSTGTLVVRSTSTTAANPVLNLQNNTGAELFRVQVDGKVGLGVSNPPARLTLGTAGPSSNWPNVYIGEYPTTGGAVYVSNWPAANFWGIGPMGGAADKIVRLGNTIDRTGTWDTTQDVSLVVGGKIGVSTGVPTTQLDVNGNAQFGLGATKSTFTTTGALTLAANAGLTLSGATGNITSGSSITTTGGFFGPGAGLTGVSGTDATKVAKGGDTMTGQLTLSGSSLTVGGAAAVGVVGASGSRFEVRQSDSDSYALTVSSNDAASMLTVTREGRVGLSSAAPVSPLSIDTSQSIAMTLAGHNTGNSTGLLINRDAVVGGSSSYGLRSVVPNNGSWAYGVSGRIVGVTVGSGRNYGTHGYATGGGANFGAYGQIANTDPGGGVFGTIPGDLILSEPYAGLFYGNTLVRSSATTGAMSVFRVENSVGTDLMYVSQNGTTTVSGQLSVTGPAVVVGTVSLSGRLTASSPGTSADTLYNGQVVTTKAAATGQHLNVIRSGNYAWSLGTIYNTNDFAIGQSQANDANFTNSAGGPIFMSVTSAGSLAVRTLAGATATTLCYNTATLTNMNTLATCTSSRRYKENIVPLRVDKKKIFELEPVRFKWKGRDEEGIGLVAEDVAAKIPDLATHHEGRVQGVRYGELSVYLLDIVRSQDKDLEQLRGELRAMQTEMKVLRAERP